MEEKRVIDQEEDDLLIKSIKEEMEGAKQENEKLKATLSRIMNDYKSLQTQYFNIIHHKESTKTLNIPNTCNGKPDLGFRTDSSAKIFSNSEEEISTKMHHDQDLDLRLNGKYDGSNNVINASTTNLSSDNSLDEPSKIEKNNEEEETVPQPSIKRARVSVRAKCDTPTMNDGCQWRKYGQKIAKGNPCPRAYYRCTVVAGCPVRKQVQRCLEDMSILITTYEGTHNHPLPTAASAMASTTSAAASMLLAGPTTSPSPLPLLNPNNYNYTSNILPYLSNHSTNYNIYPSHNASIYSSSPSHPTITLDLTKPQMLDHNNAPNIRSYNQNNLGLMSHSYLPSSANMSTFSPSQTTLTDTIAKAITTNPNFQSVLNAAITSYVGGQGPITQENESMVQGLKWGEHLALGSSTNNNNATKLESQGIDFMSRSNSSYLDRGKKVEHTKHF
ncbi:hypothetical protein LUZ60_008551 [Juncus effusus]|nr:hypothetical protein LUZ60_008551 [Juncus effusus]